MSYCLNPLCSQPQNTIAATFCSQCGFKLLLGDRYRATRAIGRGGFGRTFLAVDEYKPSRPSCVIKQFLPINVAVLESQRARELFRREAERLEQLGNHPQIPELLAHFEQAAHHYLVQEYIDGRNLTEEVSQTGAFSDRQVWQLLTDLLPVLAFVHQHQVIHRDIKPQNIIRRHSSQQSVLVDFGAAKSIQGTDLAQTGTSIGSPEFSAPEQAIGKATYASDLYSLGITAIYLLTQVRPADLFDTEEGRWIWRHHLNCPVNSVLGDILDKLLQGPLKLRYQAAAEVLRDLRDVAILEAIGIQEPHPETGTAIADSLSQLTVLPHTRLPADGWHCVQTLTGHRSWVRSVAIHPMERSLASGSGDRTIKLWHLDTGELLRTIEAHDSWVRAIAISLDGQHLASCSNDKTIKLWRWDTGELVRTLRGHTDWVRSVAFSVDGQYLVSSAQDSSVAVWQVATGDRLYTLQGHKHWVVAALFLPAQLPAERVVSASRDKTIRLWQSDRTGYPTIAHLTDHTDAVNCLAVSDAGTTIAPTTIASGSDDGTVRLWDDRGNLLQTLTGHEGAVHSVAIAPDGRLLSAGQDKIIRIWSPSGELTDTMTGHTNWIWSIAISRDGRTIASASWDGTVKLWQS